MRTALHKGSILAAALLALLAACANAAGDASTGGHSASYYVDPANGDDAQSGTSPQKPWKHAPGDPAARGRPHAVLLDAGDRVIFAAGSIYRGEIKVTRSGARDAPIVFEGAPGDPAVIDGSDPVAFTPCRDAAACGGLANWRRLVLVSLERPAGPHSRFFSDRGSLRPARSPDPTDDFYRDEPGDMASASPEQMASGELPLPVPAANLTMSEGARVVLWVQPNIVVERPITAIDGPTLRFDPTSLNFYADRPGRYAAVGLAEALDRPGEYIILPGGRQVVAMLPEGARHLSAADGRGGFELKGASNVTIRNLTFRNMADAGDQFRGVAILSNRPGNHGIAISRNTFVDMDQSRGQGAITMRGVSGLVLADNVISGIVAGSGMRLSGPARNLAVRGNRIERIGRTGIMLMRVDDAIVEGNVVSDVRGVHGNGLSAYLGNHRLRFVRNTVLNAKQPATFHGAKGSTERNDIEFSENLLVGTPDAMGSLIAWGTSTRGVAISHNVLLGGRTGLRIQPGNREVVVKGNVGVRPAAFPQAPLDWQVEGNTWFTAAPPDWAAQLVQTASVGSIAAAVPFDCRKAFGDTRVTQIGATIECAAAP